MPAWTGRYRAGTPEAVPALRGIDLTIPPGEFVSVEGPSGCGKTTLLNLLGLLDAPTHGDVRWDGRPVGPARSGSARASGWRVSDSSFSDSTFSRP